MFICRGRRRATIFCGLLQLVGCLARQSRNFYVLCLASVCQGLAISLFPTALEAWLNAEHERVCCSSRCFFLLLLKHTIYEYASNIHHSYVKVTLKQYIKVILKCSALFQPSPSRCCTRNRFSLYVDERYNIESSLQ